MHGLTLPINNEHLDKFVYGKELIPTHRVIDKVVSKKYHRRGETDTPTIAEKLESSKSEEPKKKTEEPVVVNEVIESDEDDDILDSMLRKIMKRPEPGPAKNVIDSVIKKAVEPKADQDNDKMLLEEMNRIQIKSVDKNPVDSGKDVPQNGQNGSTETAEVVEENGDDLDDMLKTIASTHQARIVRKGRKNGR